MATERILPADIEKPIEKMYLGDGVYFRFDGFQSWLETERDGMTHSIALDREVTHTLIWVSKKIYGDAIAERV